MHPSAGAIPGVCRDHSVGGFLLWLPISSAPGRSIAFIDALYTSTSAVCVTGLIVVDTPVAYSFFGQLVILLLIQAGGLGYMTLAGIIFLLLRRRVFAQCRLVTAGGPERLLDWRASSDSSSGSSSSTALVESIGALILTVRWMWDYPFGRALWLGVFHAVSAFNNAGFSLFSTNLSQYVGDPTVVLVITSNIIIGGIGYLVISELYERRSREKREPALSLHARMALTVTAFLIIGGTASLYVFEILNPKTLQHMGPFTRFLAAYFQAGHAQDGRLQHHRYRGDDPGSSAVLDRADVHRCFSRRNGRRDQDDELRRHHGDAVCPDPWQG